MPQWKSYAKMYRTVQEIYCLPGHQPSSIVPSLVESKTKMNFLVMMTVPKVSFAIDLIRSKVFSFVLVQYPSVVNMLVLFSCMTSDVMFLGIYSLHNT